MVTRPGNRVARTFPLVPGVELAGVVEESTSDEFAAGQRVLVQGYELGVSHHGGFAAYARVPADWVVPLPDTLSCRNAAIIGLAGYTALLSLNRLLRHGTGARRRPHPGHRRLGRRRLGRGRPGGQGRLRGGGLLGQVGRARLPQGARGLTGRRSRVHRGRRADAGPQLWGGVVDCVGGTALAEALRTVRYGGAVAASGLTGGNNLATTGLSLHHPRCGAAGHRHGGHADRGAAQPVGRDGRVVPARALRGDGARGDRPRRPDQSCSTRCSMLPCAAGSWWRRSLDLDLTVPDGALTATGTGPRLVSRCRTRATRRPSRCCRATWSGESSGSIRRRWATSPPPLSDSGQLVWFPTGTSEYW